MSELLLLLLLFSLLSKIDFFSSTFNMSSTNSLSWYRERFSDATDIIKGVKLLTVNLTLEENTSGM